jgi:four helix bundle protein
MSRFMQIAMGSGAELSYHLLLAKDLGYLRREDCDALESALTEVMKMLSSLIEKLRCHAAA